MLRLVVRKDAANPTNAPINPVLDDMSAVNTGSLIGISLFPVVLAHCIESAEASMNQIHGEMVPVPLFTQVSHGPWRATPKP